MKLTESEWRKRGAELFGEDVARWRFKCPTCGHVASVESLRAELTDEELGLLRGRYSLEAECIGRYLSDRGCDWAAYGLFSGPVFVLRDSGRETPVFDFAEPEHGGAAS